jgi:TadE-like protein
MGVAELESLTGRVGFRRVISKLAGLRESQGQQLVEFAISLPLLMLFVVGIFDFGSAFTVKQKLAGIAAEAARVGSIQPGNDLSFTSGDCTVLIGVCAVRDVVERSLTDAKMNDCGLASAAPTYTSGLIWTFTANTNCAGTLTLTVNRGLTYTTNLTSPFPTSRYTIEATQVTLKYPYKWQFGKVIRLVAPGTTFGGPSQLTSTATMQNIY